MLLFTLAALFSIQSYSFHTDENDLQDETRLSGRVLDKESKEPIEGITVKVHMMKGKYNDEGVTDKNGEFSYPVKSGTYAVYVNYQNDDIMYESKKVIDVRVDRNEAVQITVYLKATFPEK